MSERLTAAAEAEQFVKIVDRARISALRSLVKLPGKAFSAADMQIVLDQIDALRDDLRHALDCDYKPMLRLNTMPPQDAPCPKCAEIRGRLEER